MTVAKVVVVGSGLAGVETAVNLRKKCNLCEILIVTSESWAAYDKPLLSKKYLTDELDDTAIFRYSSESLQAMNINIMLNETVISIQTENKLLELSQAGHISYDKLILATGGIPRRLHFDSETRPNVIYLRELADAMRLKQLAQKAKNIVVIGGGFIGLEVASSLLKLGKSVNVLEASSCVLSKINSPMLSDILSHALIEKGASIHYHKRVSAFSTSAASSNGEITAVHCDDGSVYDADIVVVGVGIEPCTGLAKAAGLEIDKGIKVDCHGMTSDSSIFAVGDCASTFDVLLGKYARLESVQAAIEQARNVAASILGLDQTLQNLLPTFWTEVAGYRVQMFGIIQRFDFTVVRGELSKRSCVIFYILGHIVVAAHVINRPSDLMLARKSVVEAMSVSALGKTDEIQRAALVGDSFN